MKGDMRSSVNVLLARGGSKEGTPDSILRTLSFNGGWTDFKKCFPGEITKTEPGRYAVQICKELAPTPYKETNMDPSAFSIEALAFVLGDESTGFLAPYTDDFANIGQVIGALAEHIDPIIAGLHLPYNADETRVYELVNGLYYSARDGVFRIYGAEILNKL